MASDGDLTNREIEVLSLVVEGKRNREIANQLNIAEATVENHLHRIFVKLRVSTRTEAATYALRAGMCPQKIEDSLHDDQRIFKYIK